MRRIILAALVSLAGCTKPEPSARTPDGKPAPAKGDAPGRIPSQDFPPDDWTHKELAEYLGTKGVKVEVRSASLHSKPGQIVAGLIKGEGAERAGVVATLCADSRAARDVAGSMGAGAFHRGRFAIGTGNDPGAQDKDLLAKITAALK